MVIGARRIGFPPVSAVPPALADAIKDHRRCASYISSRQLVASHWRRTPKQHEPTKREKRVTRRRYNARAEPRRASHDTPSGRRDARAARRGVGSSAMLYGPSNAASHRLRRWPTTQMRESPQPARADECHDDAEVADRDAVGFMATSRRRVVARAESHARHAADCPRPPKKPPATRRRDSSGSRDSWLRAIGPGVRTTPSTKRKSSWAPSV